MSRLNSRMAWQLALVMLVSALLLCSGCAHVEVVKASKGKNGLRFWTPKPYLLVSPGEHGNEYKIVYLPAHPEPDYMVKAVNGLGSLEYKAELTDGWNLTSLGETRDPKIAETLSAASELLTSIGGVAGAGAARQEAYKPQALELKPGLYPLSFANGSWSIVASNDSFRVGNSAKP